jgi:Uncharacterized protein conserved in bacteria
MFHFPKSVFLKHKILSGFQSKGKMGIRVYPIWEHNLNKTAIKTQKWQIYEKMRAFLIETPGIFLYKI